MSQGNQPVTRASTKLTTVWLYVSSLFFKKKNIDYRGCFIFWIVFLEFINNVAAEFSLKAAIKQLHRWLLSGQD